LNRLLKKSLETMKSQVRRSWRKIERKFNDARSSAATLLRMNSSYTERPVTTTISRRSSTSSEDEGDDAVFVGIDVRPPTPVSMEPETDSQSSIPCEFCQEQIIDSELLSHQASCQERSQNRQVRRLSSNSPNRPRRSRRPPPSAPPAPPVPERSPSPTEGFQIPSILTCPITLTLFNDPVVASDGHTYEREAIERVIRQSQQSPLTREPLRTQNLNPNRIVKDMVDGFRAECRKKRDLYKYKIDVDLKRGDEILSMRSETKKAFLIEWSNPQQNINAVLFHLLGENALKLAEILCRVPVHPNLIRTCGRVENPAEEILIVQEYLPVQTLAELIEKHEQLLTLPLLDIIFLQIACALKHLKKSDVIFGDLTTHDVLIYQLHNSMDQNHIKLTNISNYLNVQTDQTFSSESDVMSFGLLARQCYSEKIIIDDRAELFRQCLAEDPNERPTIKKIVEIFQEWTSD